jgi:hypothetical protein
MPQTLSVNQMSQLQTAVANCSRTHIKDILLNDIKPFVNNSSWVDSNNRYLINGALRVDKDSKSGLLVSKDLKEYIAASTVLHCKDGWDYYSSAVSAILNGNFHNAIHFAYYAEVRAVMAFLACDGIGIFNGRHVYVDQIGSLKPVANSNIRTHEFVWHAIQQWAKIPNKSDIIFKSIEVSGQSIYNWLIAAGMLVGSTSTAQLAIDWLKQWSLDLELLAKDHNIRNEVSYRPQEIKRSRCYITNAKEELGFILGQWNLCEPVSSERFRMLDYFLLRVALIHRYKIHYGSNPTSRQLTSFVRGIMSGLGLSSNSLLESILTKMTYPNLNPVLKAANLKAFNNSGKYRPLSILARAFLLLRLATASTKEVINYAGLNYTELQFWWEKIGEESGFWEQGNFPNPLSDLWSDINQSVISLDEWISSRTIIDKQSLYQEMSSELIVLPQFKRAYLWGLGL